MPMSGTVRRSLLVPVIAGLFAIATGVGLAASYTTYSCGDAVNYCTVYSDAPKTAAGVALRDDNNIICAYGCHTRIYYYSASTGSFGIARTNGASAAYYLIGSGGNYVYSR